MRRWEVEIADARRTGFIDGFTFGLGVVGFVTLAGLWIAGAL